MFSPIYVLIWLLAIAALCAEDYYKVLGVGKSATEKELKKAYRQLSKKFHPDKNPDDPTAKERFVLVSSAYETLSNRETRQIYDQYGHEGLEQHKSGRRGGGGGGGDPFDLFSRFFGGGGGERKGPSIEVRVAVPLRDFYVGGETEFAIEKQGICETCGGSGSADGVLETCGHCGGRGVVVQKQMLAPGIFQQMQGVCEHCRGQGRTIRRPCKVCGGEKVVLTQESYTLDVEPGMPRGHRVVFENEAGESPDYVAGDLVVQVVEQEPGSVMAGLGERSDGTFFRRRGDDLFWREVLSLREAWMGGWRRYVTHLDGRTVRLGRERGAVVQPGLVEVVQGEGMPIWGVRDESGEQLHGKLHVEYVVVLPDQMDKSMEKEFWGLWEKWRSKKGVDLMKDSGRPEVKHEEL